MDSVGTIHIPTMISCILVLVHRICQHALFSSPQRVIRLRTTPTSLLYNYIHMRHFLKFSFRKELVSACVLFTSVAFAFCTVRYVCVISATVVTLKVITLRANVSTLRASVAAERTRVEEAKAADRTMRKYLLHYHTRSEQKVRLKVRGV